MSLSVSKKKFRSSSRFVTEVLESRQLLAADIGAVHPAADALFVAPSTDIELTFDEAVAANSGNVTIKVGNTVVETIDVTSDLVTLAGDGKLATVSPSVTLPAGVQVTVEVDAGAFIGQSVDLFSEDFESVELFPFEDETGGNDEGLDWSDQLPDGWVKDNTDTPEGGPIEFFGWTIFDKESWIRTAGNQARDSFERGIGNVFVADGDEYDDGEAGIEGDPGLMNVFLTTPEISLTGIGENEATLQFDSSFRPYPTMVGLVDVSYDGGNSWDNLLTLNDETVEGGTSSLSRANSLEVLDLNNPAGADALVRFGLVDAGNDWWWAIDNVAIAVPGQGEESAEASWSFTTAPELTPAQNSVDASPDGNLTITFDSDVKLTPGLGNVEIRQAADDSLVESIAVASNRVTASGNTVTIDPESVLEVGVEYYVSVDGFSIWDTANVNVSGITLFSEDFEGLELEDSKLVGGAENVDNYVAVISGVLDVKTAGTYTFGVNSADGQRLSIDVAQDGLDIFDDELIFDDSTHAPQVRLTTCEFIGGVQSCIDDGDPGIDLAIGEYAFEFWYFDAGGGSSGEFFYGPGDLEVFDPSSFAIVGDDSLGIGVTDAGITATVYQSALEDTTLDAINSLTRAEELVAGDIPSEAGFPTSGTIPTADVWNSGSGGLFRDDNVLPGFPEPELAPDWTDQGPEGWTREDNLPAGGAPEYQGWTFLSKEFWIAQQGDQARTTFTKGQGTLAVADPDATDDFVDVDSLLYQDAFLTSAPIPFENLAPNSMTLEFDSSFRPYDTMTGLVDVSFDGGSTWENILTLVGEDGGSDLPESSLDRANETVSLSLNNPATGTVSVRWGMDEADNDWWWAFDNIRLTSPFTGNPVPAITAGQWSFTAGEGGTSTLPEDIDMDGTVGFSDFLILSNNFGLDVEAGTMGDIDGSGTVDFADFLRLSGAFGTQVAAAPTAAAADSLFATLVAEASESEDEQEDLFSSLN